jgi:hypothetical protein
MAGRGPAFCPSCDGDVDWVVPSRAAEILGVSDRHVRALISEGAFPGAVKVNPIGQAAFWRIPLASVQARLEARTTV